MNDSGVKTSTIYKGVAFVVGIGVVIKSMIIGFYITELPWIAIGWAVAYLFYRLGEKAEQRETETTNDDLRRSNPPTDNW